MIRLLGNSGQGTSIRPLDAIVLIFCGLTVEYHDPIGGWHWTQPRDVEGWTLHRFTQYEWRIPPVEAETSS